MWISLVEMNVWIRQRSAPFSASAARVMSPGMVRASAAITGPLHAGRDLADRLELALARDGEARLEDVDAQTGELLRDLDLLGAGERDPGRLLAVAERGVEDPYVRRGRWRSVIRGPPSRRTPTRASSDAARGPRSSSWDPRASRRSREEVGEAGLGLPDPLLRERAVLDLGEDLAHAFANALVDDPGSAQVVALLGRVGDRVAHPRQAALVDQVDDELQLVQALEVRDLGLVAGRARASRTRPAPASRSRRTAPTARRTGRSRSPP